MALKNYKHHHDDGIEQGRSYGNTICKGVPIHPERADSIVVKTLNPVLYSFRDGGPLN
jgi:hypothetical protein